MNCLTPKEVQEVLVQLLNNSKSIKIEPCGMDFMTGWDLDDGFRKSVLELCGVQYIGKNGNGYEYEAIILDEYKHRTSEVMFISNILTEDVSYEEAPIKQFSDTYIHFILSQYYDPSIYAFSIDNLWQ